MGLGIRLKAIEFFLWLGLQAKFPLSYLYPFDALNRIALVAAAWFFLKERITPQTWLGVGASPPASGSSPPASLPARWQE